MAALSRTRTHALAVLVALCVLGVAVASAFAQSSGSDPTTEFDVTFNFAGVQQTLAVPPGVRAIDATATGGHGAERNGVAGGRAARVAGRIDVEGLEQVFVYVGGNGFSSSGGYNGGGWASGSIDARGGGGGGASDIRTESVGADSRLIVAAGGGGAGGHANGGGTAKAGAAGGDADADGARAESAGPENTYGSGGFGGKKGTATAGGVGGQGGFPYGGSGYIGLYGESGGLGYGGAGGPGPDNAPPGYGGGGGGGLYGGGGGGGGGLMMGGTPTATGGGGGGGGSSLVPEGGTLVLAAADGEPSITVSYTIPGTEIEGPTGVVKQDQLSFEISSEEEGTTLECRLDSDDGEAWESCGPTFETPVLAEGPHLLEARATNEMGNFDPTPARAAFTVDLKPPPPPGGGGGDSGRGPIPAPALAPGLSLGKPKLNRRLGLATLPVTVNGPGALVLRGGKKLRKASRAAVAASTMRLVVRAKGKAAKALRRRGKLRVVARVVFTAADGQVAVAKRKLTLRRALRR